MKTRFVDLDDFTQAYITAMFWTEDERLEEQGCADGDWDTLSEESRESIITDCQAFQLTNSVALARCGGDDGQAGHDFWLTRNRHGAGFWDRGDDVWDTDARKTLTDCAHAFGECNLEVGDDGTIHIC